MSIRVRNPHSVLLALKHRPSDVEKIVVSGSGGAAASFGLSGGDAWSEVIRLAESRRIPITSAAPESKKKGPKIKPRHVEEGRSTRTEAWIKEKQPVPLEKLFGETPQAGQLWIALDQIQDPHNLGAIFRTASFFGAKGIVLTRERSASLTEPVYDVSSGGVEAVPHSVVPNIQRAFELAKNRGLWILGSSEHASESIYSVQPDRPWLLVLGNEEKGMRRLTAEACDVVCRIPIQGEVDSLNVSVAAGILISQVTQKN